MAYRGALVLLIKTGCHRPAHEYLTRHLPPCPFADFQQDSSGVRLSLALGYALMTHLARATWLSKEVIWLLPDASCGLVAAVQAWTDVYQMMVSLYGGG